VPLLKQVIRAGKYQKQRLNLTIWVIIDVTVWLDKLVVTGRKAKKTVKDMLDKEYSIDFCNLFDICLDVTQFSNSEVLGKRYLSHQENYMVSAFVNNLEEPPSAKAAAITNTSRSTTPTMFDYRELKCYCTSSLIKDKQMKEEGCELSIGETFIQYYYLYQRRLHA